MDFQEVLKWTDEQIFAKTGEHLDSLQATILQGTWQGQKYPEIAENYKCSEIHVKKKAAKLWHLLSEVLGEDIHKLNFRAIAERFHVSHIYGDFSGDFVQIGKIGNINICGEKIQTSKVPSLSRATPNYQENPRQTQIDLREAPEIFRFYNRTQELATLKQWLLTDRSRLITLFGLSGIGKTALAVQLVAQIQDRFDYIIWRSLNTAPTLAELQANIIQFLNSNNHPNNPPYPEALRDNSATLLDYFRADRCLVILDDVQMIFSSQELAAEYQPGWENYGLFFEQIAELSHQSCLLLLGWQKPRSVTKLEGETAPVRSLQLNGLGESAREIFREKGLKDEEKWDEAIATYGDNPLWLKLIAATINDLFGGRVGEFLTYDPLFLSDDLMAVLAPMFQGLSDVEKVAIAALANATAAVSLAQLQKSTQLSPSDLLKAMQSLSRRCLIEKRDEAKEIVFSMQPIVKAYVKICRLCGHKNSD
jgi:hypothetical protein